MTANEFFEALYQAIHDFGLGFLLAFIGVLLIAIVAEFVTPPKPREGRHRLNEDQLTQRLPDMQEAPDGMA